MPQRPFSCRIPPVYTMPIQPGIFSLLQEIIIFCRFGMLIQAYTYRLSTAKDCVHPQFPQAYPHIPGRKMPVFRGLCESCPHHPQLIHILYQQCPLVWIGLWITCIRHSAPFTFVKSMHDYACSRMFPCVFLFFPARLEPNLTSCALPRNLSARESPKTFPVCPSKKPVIPASGITGSMLIQFILSSPARSAPRPGS